MDIVTNNFLPGDQLLVDKIVYELKAQGIFDQFRKECFADVDTKPAYQNLRQRVEGSVASFLKDQSWRPDMNKNQVREMLRKKITESGFLETGVERIVDQVVNPKMNTVFLPKVEEVVYNFLGIQKPELKPNRSEVKTEPTDLLPNDLEAVSPESEPVDKKDDKSNDNIQDMDESKTEEDDSPPFEPIDDKASFVPLLQEENSVDSAFSGLASHESNQSIENKLAVTEQDSQMSRNSSESRLSIVTSDDNTKMEVSENVKSTKPIDSNGKPETDKSKPNTSEKHKSRSEHKHEKDRKCNKDSKSKHSSSSKDTEKSRDRKDSKSSSTNKTEKDKKDKDKYDKDRKKSSSSSSKHSSSSSNNKDKSTIKKESSRSDKEKDKQRSSSHKDSKPKEKSNESSKTKEKSSTDKHKHSSQTDKHKKDKKRDKLKDDHYSSKEKRSDRRSTDRDSNDGSSSRPSHSLMENLSQRQKSSQESMTSENTTEQIENTTKAPINVTATMENNEVLISSTETQRVKVYKPKCAANIQEALRLRKIRRQLAKLEKKNQLCLTTVEINSPILLSSSITIDDLKTDKMSESDDKLDDVETMPHTVTTQDNWDAMEAKLQDEITAEFKQSSHDNIVETEGSKDVKIESNEANCKYFESVDLQSIEFLTTVDKFINNVSEKTKKKETNDKTDKTIKRKIEDNDVENNNKLIIPDKKAKLKKPKDKLVNHVNENLPLPLSPAESDSSIGKKDENTVIPIKVKRNSINKMNSQRYSSDDLYKPRSTFASSRRRGAKNLQN